MLNGLGQRLYMAFHETLVTVSSKTACYEIRLTTVASIMKSKPETM